MLQNSLFRMSQSSAESSRYRTGQRWRPARKMARESRPATTTAVRRDMRATRRSWAANSAWIEMMSPLAARPSRHERTREGLPIRDAAGSSTSPWRLAKLNRHCKMMTRARGNAIPSRSPCVAAEYDGSSSGDEYSDSMSLARVGPWRNGKNRCQVWKYVMNSFLATSRGGGRPRSTGTPESPCRKAASGRGLGARDAAVLASPGLLVVDRPSSSSATMQSSGDGLSLSWKTDDRRTSASAKARRTVFTK